MTAMRSTLRLGAAAALAAGALSCGLFDTRDPAEPEPINPNCRPLTGNVAIILNVEDSYGRISLVTCYTSMIGETFLFHPDPQDSLQNPLAFAGWDEIVEASHNSQVGTEQTFIEVVFPSEYQSHLESTDRRTETWFYEYLIRVAGLDDNPDTLRYTGLADITIQLGNDGQWRIIDWADHRGSVSDSTWGLLRSSKRPGP
jgi:hypothetical protein